MFGTYIGNNKMLVKTVYGGMLTISSEDLSLMPSLVVNGAIEGSLTHYFYKHVKKGETVIDVGTNIGYFTIMAGLLVGKEGRVIGFEANPNVYELTKDNLSINWLKAHAKVYNKAIYSKETTLDFYTSDKFQGDSSIHVKEDESVKKILIEANSLDNLLSDLNQIDLVKIDIEGAEYHAFLGMNELIEKGKIKRIVFEWNKTMLGEDAENLEELLAKYIKKGQLYAITNDGEKSPMSLYMLTQKDFYPHALIEFE
jgi:FkbM family methyltransferase